MPALASITINDGQATPVAHTFNPSGPDRNGASHLFDRSGGIAIGFPEILLSLTTPAPARSGQESTSNRLYRASFRITVPVLEVTSPQTGTGIQPAPTKGYDMTFKGEFILPERSTLQNRKDILAYAKNLLAHAFSTSLVQDLESIY